MSLTSKRLAEQVKKIEEGKKVYCVRCLKELFYLSEEETNSLIDAGPGECPRCEGPGPLFFK
jgi:hypothetical protein